MFGGLVSITLGLIIKFSAVILYSPMFTIPGMLVAAGGALLGRIYMAAQLPVKREMSNARYVGRKMTSTVAAHWVGPLDPLFTHTSTHQWLV